MSLFGGKEKKELARQEELLAQQKEELERLKAQTDPRIFRSIDLDKQIADSQAKLAELQSKIQKTTLAANLDEQIETAQNELDCLNDQIQQQSEKLAELEEQVIETDENVLMQSFGMYTPHYQYTVSELYKVRLKDIRSLQKEIIKAGRATTGNERWQVNDSLAKGKKMVNDMQKLLLRAFNAECDDAIEHVRFSNITASEKKINASAAAISKLGSIMGISITNTYLNLKLDELHLMHEYQVKKQEEKEAAKEARQRQREEAKVAKELEEARKKLAKEQTHYENALKRLNAQIDATSSPEAKKELLVKKAELLEQLSVIDHEMKDVDYRAANQRAGHVYVISNIGAFGEDIYKIGMTRRLEPMDRVNELGDASVPFNFDVHAMIFTEDAPGLEAALHNAFADRKLNCVNLRREFFHVTLDEIKEVVRKNYDKTVEFVDIPPAEQYRESLRMRQQA